jgi:hypothetical protein
VHTPPDDRGRAVTNTAFLGIIGDGSMLSFMLTTDNIDPSVKDFYFILYLYVVSIIDKILVKPMAIDPSVHFHRTA